MSPRKPWWLLNNEQARKNRQKKTSATARPVPPGGIAVSHPGPRPPVYTLPTPWPPHVPPQVEPDQTVVPGKPRKKKLSSPEEAQLVDDLIDKGLAEGKPLTLTKARLRIAKQQGKTFQAIEVAHRRHGRHKGPKKKNRRKNLSSKNRKKKNH